MANSTCVRIHHLGVVLLGGNQVCLEILIAEALLYLVCENLYFFIPHVDEVQRPVKSNGRCGRIQQLGFDGGNSFRYRGPNRNSGGGVCPWLENGQSQATGCPQHKPAADRMAEPRKNLSARGLFLGFHGTRMSRIATQEGSRSPVRCAGHEQLPRAAPRHELGPCPRSRASDVFIAAIINQCSCTS